jgi:hypothetical protein
MKRVWVVAPAVLLLLAAALFVYRPAGHAQCDGVVPTWAAKYYPAGCGLGPPLFEYLLPWHWNTTDMTCIGMCLEPALASPHR